MKYIAYRVKDGTGKPGAVVCREFTDDEYAAAKTSRHVLGQVEIFESDTDPWDEAYRKIGIRK